MSEINHAYAHHLAETIEHELDDASAAVFRTMRALQDFDRSDAIVPNEILTAYLAGQNVSVALLDRMLVELLEVRTRIAQIAEDTIRLEPAVSE